MYGRTRQLQAFEGLKACLVSAPILGFPTENGRFVLDPDASLFAVGGVLSQLQDDSEVVIANASHSLRLSQRRYCTTRREMLAAVVMCTHFRSYLRGAQLTLRTDHTMDADLLPELSGETWVASALLEEFTADLRLAGVDMDVITASHQDPTLATV